MKKRLFRIVAVALCILMTAGITVSAKSSDSFIHYYAGSNVFSTISRDMFEPVLEITDETLGQEIMDGVTDIFCKDGYTYVLNGEYSKLFVLNSDLSFNREITFKTEDGIEESFKGAKNVYIDHNNTLYLSDTDMARVFVADLEGNIKRFIELPDLDIIPDEYIFQPTSVVVDQDNNIYVLSLGSYYGALYFSSDYEFKGFYGANKVQHTALDAIAYIWDLITNTDEKRAKDDKTLPFAFNDISIDTKGYLYTVTGIADRYANTPGQISMLSPSGENILMRRDNRGDSSSSSGFQFAESKLIFNWEDARTQDFVGIVIDSSGFIHALDSTYGLVYVYDSDCNLITTYGGGVKQGNQLGLFGKASAIALKGDDTLVLDEERDCITLFRPTEYGKLVREAQPLYLGGNYGEAKELWTKILSMDSNSLYALRGLAKAYYAEGDYEAAMKYAEPARDYSTYDLAFQQIRNELISKNFTWLFLGIILLLAGLVVLLVRMKKRETPLITNIKLHTLTSTLVHPFGAFNDIKYKGYGSTLIAIVLIILFTLSSIIKSTGSSFLFRTIDAHNYNAVYTLTRTLGLVVLWIICNYLASVLMSGKGTFKEIAIGTSYSLVPVIVANFLITGLSYVLTYDDVTFINTITTVATIYTFYLLFIAITTVHEYGMGKFLLNAVVAIFFMILVVFIIFMVVILLQQLFSFIETIYMEVAYR